MRVLDVVLESQCVGVFEPQELDPWLQPERPKLLDLFGGVEGLVMVLVIVSSRPTKWNCPAATEESATYPLARLHQPHYAGVKVRARLPRRGFLVAAQVHSEEDLGLVDFFLCELRRLFSMHVKHDVACEVKD